LRFLVDEHLPVGLVDLIADLGFEAFHVKSEGLLSASDGDLWARAADLGATVVSKDSDFLPLAQRDRRQAGLLHLNLGNISNRELYGIVRAAWPQTIEKLKLGDAVVELRA
jgi:predicted nuclease of predicted toxin-antitoxin system